MHSKRAWTDCWRGGPVKRAAAGFTLLEVLIVLAMIGTLSAIAAPAWTTFQAVRKLNVAQDQVHRALRMTRSNAVQEKAAWQFSIRETNGVVQLAVHPETNLPSDTAWQNLEESIQLDTETTLQRAGEVRRIKFDYHGNVKPPFGRVTLSSRRGGSAKRCVIVSTLLGAMRQSKEQSRPQRGKYCY